MKYTFIAAGLAALTLGACTTVQQQASLAPAEQSGKPMQTADVDMTEVVCRKEQTTGTRFAKKRCQTRQAWEDEAKNVDNNGDILSNAQRRGLQYSPEGG